MMKADGLDVESESRGNSIDRFIENGYSCEEMSDGEYLSDQSLKRFIKKLKSQEKEKDKTNFQLNQKSGQMHQDQAKSYEEMPTCHV